MKPLKFLPKVFPSANSDMFILIACCLTDGKSVYGECGTMIKVAREVSKLERMKRMNNVGMVYKLAKEAVEA